MLMEGSIAKPVTLLLLLALFLLLSNECFGNLCSNTAIFHRIHGLDCVRPEFVETHSGVTCDHVCSWMCSKRLRCQAFTFTTAGGVCGLFVFDQCSKDVRDCSCTAKAQIFVKQQKGLGAGLLCPTGYGNDRCGVKYRVESVSRKWTQHKAVCESDKGLTIMAEPIDSDKLQHIVSIMQGVSIPHYHLGGQQLAGSSEPAGGWHWLCGNRSIDLSLAWTDNHEGKDSYMGVYNNGPKMNDLNGDWAIPSICECVSPFDLGE